MIKNCLVNMKIAGACFPIMMKGYISKFSQGIHALVYKKGPHKIMSTDGKMDGQTDKVNPLFTQFKTL